MKTSHWLVIVAAALLPGCRKQPSSALQGYVEGEFVYVAAPYGGQVRQLAVRRGDKVNAGDVLFRLEATVEQSALEDARQRLAQAKALAEDIRKGRRPTEIAALEAQLAEAKAAQELSEKEVQRQERLETTGATSIGDLDRARARREQDRQRILQLQAELATAKLGGREDALAAATAEAQAREAAVRKAEWDLAQKTQQAPQGGLVFDVLYREGEWVAPGRPAVVLLPPQNLKVRTFVPEAEFSRIKVGGAAHVRMDGVAQPVTGKVSFLSPQAEFTPPVIYSKEARSKLVYLVEISLAPEIAAALHPGQPVDVEIVP